VDVVFQRCGKKETVSGHIPSAISFSTFPIQTVGRQNGGHCYQILSLLFVLNRLVRMKLLPELTLHAQKIVCLEVKNVASLKCVYYLFMPLRNLPEAFDLTAEESWKSHRFKTAEKINYVVPISTPLTTTWIG